MSDTINVMIGGSQAPNLVLPLGAVTQYLLITPSWRLCGA